MKLKCSICCHPALAAINQGLHEGVNLAALASHYQVSAASLSRHKKHLSHQLAEAKKARELAQAEFQVQDLLELKARALRIADQAESEGNFSMALHGVREAVRTISVINKLKDGIDDLPALEFTQTPQWRELRSLILTALEPFPESRQAVFQALQNAYARS